MASESRWCAPMPRCWPACTAETPEARGLPAIASGRGRGGGAGRGRS
jgi:hypothetical protein